MYQLPATARHMKPGPWDKKQDLVTQINAEALTRVPTGPRYYGDAPKFTDDRVGGNVKRLYEERLRLDEEYLTLPAVLTSFADHAEESVESVSNAEQQAQSKSVQHVSSMIARQCPVVKHTEVPATELAAMRPKKESMSRRPFHIVAAVPALKGISK